MLTRSLPERVDHRKLVNDQAILQGTIPLHRFTRLVQSLERDAGDLNARLEFRKGGKRRTLVVGRANVEVSLICQACLDSLVYSLDVEVRLNLVNSDSDLLELDLSENGLVVESNLAVLVDLFEDELIVNLPMVPRHEDGKCRDTSGFVSDVFNKSLTENSTKNGEMGEDRVRPFAALSEMQEQAKTKQ